LVLSWIENGSLTRASYIEGNKWNRNSYQEYNRGKNGEEYGNVCINTGFYEWLRVRKTLRIME
jgi:hypothetical protein